MFYKMSLLLLIVMSSAMCTEQDNLGFPNDSSGIKFENAWIQFRMIARTPDQMAAFYIGRGFPSAAVEATREACIITVGMRNLTQDILWLNLNEWEFISGKDRIERINRAQWQETWHRLALPKSLQSTFSWTMLPEQRDLHYDEPVGGNMTLRIPESKFSLVAKFKTGKKQDGPVKTLRIDQIQCEKNP